MRPSGSLGRQSVAEARSLIGGYRPGRPDRRPAFEYTPPGDRPGEPGERRPPVDEADGAGADVDVRLGDPG
ncbi:MAG: hypothetical protein QOG82_669, partial [Actinomycetota bacterium]|nr:hypothetical protein [Actinomycetota bacterium]